MVKESAFILRELIMSENLRMGLDGEKEFTTEKKVLSMMVNDKITKNMV